MATLPADKISSNWGVPQIKVESVQHLALEESVAVPARYIRSDSERPTVATTLSPCSIPVIDLANLSEGPRQRQEQLSKMAKACAEWGFFQVVNHGVPHSLMDGIKRVAKEFFQFPLEEKQKYASRDFQGYGQVFVVSEEQKLDWGDLMALLISPPTHKNLSQWPTEPTDFRETVDAYNSEIQKLGLKLLSLIAETLQLKPDYFQQFFGNTYQTMRMNYYPPCPRPDLVLGLSPHADGSAITLLLQDDDTEGLHIRKDGQWVAVQPTPHALVINIGNLLEVMTNGRYRSIEHRAVANKDKPRLSIAIFYSPGFDVEIGPAPELIDVTHPCLFRKFIHQHYIEHYLARTLRERGGLYEYAGVGPQMH